MEPSIRAPYAAAFGFVTAVVAFSCTSMPRGEIVVRTTGAARNVVRLTQSREDELNPAVSPDGKSVAFQGIKQDQYEIYTVDAVSGLSRTQVTNHPAQDFQPCWMPDSRTLVFSSTRLGRPSLWRQLASGGGGCTMITRGGDMSDYAPNIVAASGTICFHSFGIGEVELQIRATGAGRYDVFRRELPHIWRVSVDGTNLTEFGEGAKPTWSPDAAVIAFCSDVTDNWDIWTMTAEGTALTQVTADTRNQIDPCFSPDGKWLAYISNEGGNYDLWIMKADGTAPTQLTSDTSEEATPCWNANGDIVFCSKKSGNWDIWRLTPVLPE